MHSCNVDEAAAADNVRTSQQLPQAPQPTRQALSVLSVSAVSSTTLTTNLTEEQSDLQQVLASCADIIAPVVVN